MFFGLEVKNNQGQSKPLTLTNTIKLSQAVLVPTTNGKKEPVQLVAEWNKKQFVLCVLEPGKWQVPLDLMFEGGTQVKFFLRGAGTVHLTGYENFDDLDDMSMSMSSDEDIPSSDDEELYPKTKATKKTNGVPSKAGPKKPAKDTNADVNEDDDDDSEDDDFSDGGESLLDEDEDDSDDMDDEDMLDSDEEDSEAE